MTWLLAITGLVLLFARGKNQPAELEGWQIIQALREKGGAR
jgi:hypothetical protein